MAKTHTIFVKLSHEMVISLIRWLFREATPFFSLLALSPLRHQKNLTWHCMGRPMRLMTYSNVLALIKHKIYIPLHSKYIYIHFLLKDTLPRTLTILL
jgi:hypothetical protein